MAEHPVLDDTMENKKLIAIVAVISVMCLLGTSLCMTTDVEADDGRTLVVETSPDFAPFDYQVGQEYAGIDMDIVRAVCNDMGCNVEFRTNTFDSILMSVPSGKCDLGASGFSINPDREKIVNFSLPYAEINQVVVAPTDTDIRTMEDLDGKIITVQTGTTGADYAAARYSNDNIKFQKTYSDVLLDLNTGKADAEIVDSTVALAQCAANSNLKVLDILEDSPVEQYGFIFSKENTALRDEFNRSLQHIMDNGLYDMIMSYYEDNGYSPDTPSFFTTKGTLVVETSPDFPPYDNMHGQEYVGIDMDIMRAIGYQIGYNIEFRQNTFDSIILSVQQGKCDVGASGFTIDDDRKQKVDFSTPYAEIHQVLVVKEDSNIQSKEDLRGRTVTSQLGSSGAEYATNNLPGTNLIQQKDYNIALLDVMSGKAVAEVVDNTVAEAQVAANDGLKILDILDDADTEYYGLIFQKGNTETYNLVNDALETLIANGTVDKIIEYYSSHIGEDVASFYSGDAARDEGGDDGPGQEETEDVGWWQELKDRFHNDFLKNDRYLYIFDGLKNTLIITAIALIIGLIIGSVVAMVRSTHDQTGKLKILNAICHVYITVIRGTPVMVQLLLIYYVVFATSDQGILIASVAFGLNSGAYVAEVVRSGITAVPKGQMEACRSLGMNNRMSMTNVILPQAVRNILPAIGNEGISLLKETSVAGYIGIMDLTRGADIIRGQTYDALLPIIVAAIIYLAIVLVLTYLIRRLEKRLNNAY